MQPNDVDQVMQIIRDLAPRLDAIGFHINSIGGPSAAGRLTVAYDESTAVPDALVDAIARVTKSDVDFVHAHTIAIAQLDAEHVERHKPWRAPRSIEQLLTERDREQLKPRTSPLRGPIDRPGATSRSSVPDQRQIPYAAAQLDLAWTGAASAVRHEGGRGGAGLG